MNSKVDTSIAEKYAAEIKRWASCASATSEKESVIDSTTLFQIADIISGQIDVINALRQDSQDYKRRADHFEERFNAMWKDVITLKCQQAPVGYLNTFTGMIWNLKQQPGAEADPQVHAPVFLAARQLPSRVTAQDMRETFNYLMTEEEAQASANGFNQCVSELSAAPKPGGIFKDGE